ncbi:hypothetical protein [Endozoicomonas atrinae]|uniref:hypothetical protein n=1 Tax=Endozoicomonas atrinae TaxID=1333660 RepID=UPI003AFF8A18
MATPMTSPGQRITLDQSSREHIAPKHSPFTAETQPPANMVAFGRKLEHSQTGLEVRRLHYASTHRVPLHQRRMESIESEEAEEAKKEAATDPTYSNYKKLYDDLFEKYQGNVLTCCIRGFGMTDLKAHLVDVIEGYFEEFRHIPITLTGNTERLGCFIKTALLIYCKYKEKCLDPNHQLRPEFDANFENIDRLHLKLFCRIHSTFKESGDIITKVLKEKTLPEAMIADSYPNIYPLFQARVSDEYTKYRIRHQTYYPDFLNDLLNDRLSEKQVFTWIPPQFSVDSVESTTYSGIVAFEVSDPVPSGS